MIIKEAFDILNSEKLARLIAGFTLEKKAEQTIIMDMRAVTTITDYFVICSADSEAQVKAITDHISDQLKKQQINIWHTEGYESLNWVLLDLVDVVVHIFRPEIRSFYNLEGLWGDAEISTVEA
ncbi:MAG TPA: ribosome silencing factor [bacterium]|nr:ribosome silencing factor [bacterium]